MPVSPPRHDASIIGRRGWRRRADSNRRIGVLQTPALDHLATSPRRSPNHDARHRAYGPTNLAPAVAGHLVPRARLELARPCGHSALNAACLPFQHLGSHGGGRSERTRTPDLRFWRPLLYQLSYAPATGWLPHLASRLCGPEPTDMATRPNHTAATGSSMTGRTASRTGRTA